MKLPSTWGIKNCCWARQKVWKRQGWLITIKTDKQGKSTSLKKKKEDISKMQIHYHISLLKDGGKGLHFNPLTPMSDQKIISPYNINLI